MSVKYLVCVVVRLVLVILGLQGIFSFIQIAIMEGLPQNFLLMPFLLFSLWLVVVMILWVRYDIFVPKSEEITVNEIDISMARLLKVTIVGVSFYIIISTLPVFIFTVLQYFNTPESGRYNENTQLYLLISNSVQIFLAVFCIVRVNWLTHFLLGTLPGKVTKLP